MNTPDKKPVRLEVNNSGAWKIVMRFDAGDDEASARVMDAAEQLGQIDAGKTTWRIVTDEPLPCVLTHWSKQEGWRTA